MRSLQIRGLFFIGPKLDFISTFENLAVLKVVSPGRDSALSVLDLFRCKNLIFAMLFGWLNLHEEMSDFNTVKSSDKQSAPPES